MEKYNLKIYPAAKRDMIKIIEYINELSPKVAEEQYQKLVTGILSLRYLPRRCSTFKNEVLRKKGYRFLKINNYLVVFVVRELEVQIKRIIHNKRDYEFLINID